MQKKLINQLKFDLAEFKRLKKELQRYSDIEEYIEIINHRIKNIKVCIKELKNYYFETLTKEQQDYILELPTSNAHGIRILELAIKEGDSYEL